MFVDTAEILVKAGDGGNGCVSFRREKYIPKGGPDGGDGGHGGSVIFEVDPEKNTLLDFSGRHHWNATDGRAGSGAKRSGRGGNDLVVGVPPGTAVYDLGLRDEHERSVDDLQQFDADLGEDVVVEPVGEFAPEDDEVETKGLLIADLTEPGQRVVIAEGGRGGMGNFRFRSSTNQAPREHTPGTPGVKRRLRLELRLMADVGLAGFPNAGKSTLLGALSRAKPKVASYPFTTLEPQLGISELDFERRLVFADIPGLISGAAEGQGLGHAFLRHIERCRVVLHVIDVSEESGNDPVAAYHVIRGELERFSPVLAEKPSIVAANKTDLLIDDEPIAKLREALPGTTILPISGATRSGLDELKEACWSLVHPTGDEG